MRKITMSVLREVDELEFDVMARIKELCDARSWSVYRLAKESNINHAALNTMMRRTSIPSIPSLEKICKGFGITLAQFFSLDDKTASFTEQQKECLTRWDRLDSHSQELALAYMDGLADRQNKK